MRWGRQVDGVCLCVLRFGINLLRRKSSEGHQHQHHLKAPPPRSHHSLQPSPPRAPLLLLHQGKAGARVLQLGGRVKLQRWGGGQTSVSCAADAAVSGGNG